VNGQAVPDLYDSIPYTDHAYAEAHPDRLAVVAALAGWSAPGIRQARVLEVGCGRGGNLLPMASQLPGATLVGVDRSARQIDHAREVALAAGLRNVTFSSESLEDAAVEEGSFDFVIAHGVWSWVPTTTRKALLSRIARWLAPGGVAYVSFNVLPGWYERAPARDWLRFAAARLGESPQGAQASLEWLRDRMSPELGAYRRSVDDVARRLGETESAYVVHEHLAEEHHPETVRVFLGEAGGAGLAYLGDAIPQTTALELLDGEAAARAERLETNDAQQLVDFVRFTAFRRTLLVREDERARRGWKWPAQIDVDALASMLVASRLKPARVASEGGGAARPDARVEVFEGAGLSVQVTDAETRRMLHELARAAPRALPVPAGVARELFDLWLATGALDLHTYEPALATSPDERPTACPVARWHAAHGGPLTNLWHQEVVLVDEPVRGLLARLDGTHTRAELARSLGPFVPAGLQLLADSALILR
jgi:SAM-dependent methyltransferase